jgi:hypothetical protein
MGKSLIHQLLPCQLFKTKDDIADRILGKHNHQLELYHAGLIIEKYENKSLYS